MIRKTLDEHIEITPGVCGGEPRVSGRRITVRQIVTWHDRMGVSADEIAADYNLTISDVYAALAYYFDHREEIDAATSSDAAVIEELRRSVPSKLKPKLPGSDANELAASFLHGRTRSSCSRTRTFDPWRRRPDRFRGRYA